MKGYLLLLSSILLVSVASWAQPGSVEWSVTLDGTRAYPFGLASAPEGGYIVCGSGDTGLGPDEHGFVAKVNPRGEIEWQAEYPYSSLGSVATISDGYVFAGSRHPWSQEEDAWLLKLNFSGDTVWQQRVERPGTQRLAAVLALGNGHIVGAGYADTSGNRDAYVIHADSAGNPLWERRLGTDSTTDEATALAPAEDGEFYVGGFIGANLFVTRMDTQGDTIWSHVLALPQLTKAYALERTADGGVVAAGCSNCDIGACAVYLVKLYPYGLEQWFLTLETIEYSRAFDVLEMPDTSYVITGQTVNSQGGQALLARVSPTTGTRWTISWPGVGGYGVLPSENGGYVLAYQCADSIVQDPACLLRTTPDGVQAVRERRDLSPSGIWLSASPNPFNSATTIRFDLPRAGEVRLEVFDVTGRRVRTLQEGMVKAGRHSVRLEAGDLPSGIYFARLQAGGQIRTQKLMLLK